MSQQTVHFVVMGVCGCGKTTAAQALQADFNSPYAGGDDFHTQANRDKMGAGIPLTDEDRYPWLRNLRDWMSEQSGKGERYSVVTCSALKRQYRDILREAEGEVVFIHLAPPHDVNLARMMARKGHYMKAEMLTSQEAILEELGADEAGVRIDNAGEPAEVEAEMLAWVKAQGFGG